MLHVRRFPGIIYNNRFGASLTLLIILTFIFLLFHWGFVCSNLEPWSRVKTLCIQYKENKVVGDLCRPLCDEGRFSSLSCQTFHAGKEAVFSTVRDGNTKLVFKLAHQMEQPSTVHWMDNGVQRYPSEDEFTRMIIDHVSSRLNTTISWAQASALSGGSDGSGGAQERHQEMQERWVLLQDNEYLLASLYADREVFPRVLGSCGQYFALEHLQPAIQGHVRAEAGSWAARVKVAILILDLLQEIDNSVSEGFSLCDIKPSHFGLSETSGKVKFLDLDVALPRTIVNAITADGSECRVNADCSLFDCHSRCNADTHRCDSPQTNDNFQIVCEKIFLGWTVSGSLVLPGLLMAPQTPSSLASLLRQCVHTDSDGIYPTPTEHLKDRLMATLQEMDKTLSLDNY